MVQRVFIGFVALLLASVSHGQSTFLTDSGSMVETIASLDEVEEIVRDTQWQFWQVVPPSQDDPFYLHLEQIVRVVDWSSKDWPNRFLKQMYAELGAVGAAKSIFPFYPLTVVEERGGDIVYYNTYNQEVWRTAAPKDYNPYLFAFLKYGFESESELNDQEKLFGRSSNVGISLILLPSDFASLYEEDASSDSTSLLLATATVETEATSTTLLRTTSSIPSLPSDGGSTGSVASATNVYSGPVTLQFSVPSEFGDKAEIFQKDSLRASHWTVALNSMSVTGGTEFAWTDPCSSNVMTRFYILSDADIFGGADSDGDGYSDGREYYVTDTEMNEFNSVDSDNDGLHDWFEIMLWGSITNQGGTNDFDGDTLSNVEEMELTDTNVIFHSDPTLPDTDGGGLDDGFETTYTNFTFDPLDPSDDLSDLDNDGLNNYEECIWETDLNNQDSDRDGVNDGAEVLWAGYADSNGVPANPTVSNVWDWADDSDVDGLSLEDEYTYGTSPSDSSMPNLSDILLMVDISLGEINTPPSGFWNYQMKLAGPSTSTINSTHGSLTTESLWLRLGQSYKVLLSRERWEGMVGGSYSMGRNYTANIESHTGSGLLIVDPIPILGWDMNGYIADGYFGWDSYTVEATLHLPVVEQEFSEYELSGDQLVASGRWRVSPDGLNGMSVTVQGTDSRGAVLFTHSSTIEGGIVEFDGLESIMPWVMEQTSLPTITWTFSIDDLSFSAGSTSRSLFQHRWQENALSQGRKISLAGMPMPDVAQHQEGESDYQPESTYVDALNLDVRHDVTDIYIPVGSDQFALEVRRSLMQESWTTNSFHMEDRPDRPFGPCWSSAICPNLHVVSQGTDRNATFTDYNGQSYTFRHDEAASDGEMIDVAWAEPSSSQSALSLHGVEYHLVEGEGWELVLPNGTRCVYEESPSVATNIFPVVGAGSGSTHEYHRILYVEDRAGNRMDYGVPSFTNSIIPSSIATAGQSITIHAIDEGKRIGSIDDARENSVVYHYLNGRLSQVEREDDGTTDYTYSLATEYDTKTDDYPDFFTDGIDAYHMTINSISDANGNTYEFSYTNALRYDYSEVTQIASGSSESNRLYQIGNPLILTSIERPDHEFVYFEEYDDDGIGTCFDGTHYYLQGDRANIITDVNGRQWSYYFSDYYVTDPTQGKSDFRLFEYRKLEITAPDGMGSETYRFEPLDVVMTNGLCPMAIAVQTNFSGQVTRFEYNYATNGIFKPSVQYDALNNPTWFTYTTNYGNQLATQTNALGQYTVYEFDNIGNRTSSLSYDADGTLQSETRMFYTSTNFPNFMTKKIVKKIGNESETWIQDLVTKFEPNEYGKVETQIVDPDLGHLNLTTQYGYDLNNNLTSAIDPRGNETVNSYDALNRMTNISFYAGSGATRVWKSDKRFWYDRRSNKRWERDENGHYTYFEYDECNKLTKTILVMRSTGTGAGEFDPSVISQLEAANYAGGYEGDPLVDLISSSGFNPDGTLSYTTDERGLVTTNRYDAICRLTTTIVDPDGVAYTNSFDYGENCGGITLPPYKFNPTAVTDARGFTTQQDFDELNRPIRTLSEITNGVMSVMTTMGYDSIGNLLFATNWLSDTEVGLVTETRYDGLNRAYQTILYDPVNTNNTVETGIRYTSTGLQWQSTNELDRVSTVEYDAAGRAVLTRSPKITEGTQTLYAETLTGYDANGNAEWVQDANGNVTTNRYDYRNRPTQVILPLVRDWEHGGAWRRPTTVTTYDPVGNVTSVTDARENTTTNFYDAANRLIETWGPEVSVYGTNVDVRPITQNIYDQGGNIRFTTDANHRTVEMQYDRLGRLTNTVDAVYNTISFSYDASGNQFSLTDGNTNTTYFVYDGLNRKTSTIYPDTSHEDAGYDRLGNRTTRTDCNRVETRYGYDFRSRLKRVSYMDGSTTNRIRRYQYDLAGNLLDVLETGTQQSELGNVHYTYDALNRVKTETSVGATHSYQYDLNGNRTNAVYGVTGRIVNWTYDPLNRIEKISENGNETFYRYDLNSNPVFREYPSGVQELRSYDAMSRLLDMTTTNSVNGESFALGYIYDAVGSARMMNQQSWNLAGKASDATTYWQYDGRYRLTNETIAVVGGTTSSSSYAWDNADNRREKRTYVGGALTATTVYTNNALNQMTGWGDGTTSVEYQYDANGARTNKTVSAVGSSPVTTSYVYDEDNRLLSVSAGAVVSEFRYDYRTRRYYRSSGSETNICVFDGGLSVQEYGDTDITSESLLVEYLRGPDMGGGVGGMVYSTRGGSNLYSHANHRGDVIARSDANGSLTWFALYEAFGTRLSQYEWGTDPDRFKSNTKEEESDFRISNDGHRYRDLETGTYLTRDPTGYADGPNIYCFVHCNPITFFDALGLGAQSISAADTSIAGKVRAWAGRAMATITARRENLEGARESDEISTSSYVIMRHGNHFFTDVIPSLLVKGGYELADNIENPAKLQLDFLTGKFGREIVSGLLKNVIGSTKSIADDPTSAEAWTDAFLAYEDVGFVAFGVKKLAGGVKAPAPKISNPVPSNYEFARVLKPDQVAQIRNGGNPFLSTWQGADDAFITTSKSIPSGLTQSQAAEFLTIPQKNVGGIIRFQVPNGTGVATPINRNIPGFINGGRTAGGLPEFVIPNQPVNNFNFILESF